MYSVIETTVFVFTGLWVVQCVRLQREPCFIIAGVTIFISVCLELMNELVFPGTGTVYPASLLRLPGTMIPLAILLFSGVFTALLFSAVRFLTAPFISLRGVVSTVCYGVLLLLCFLVEAAGTASGYWEYRVDGATALTVGKSVYLFYLVLTAPGMIIGALVLKGRNRAHS